MFIFLTPFVHDVSLSCRAATSQGWLVPLSPCWPGNPELPGNPFLPVAPGSPRGPWLPGGPGGPGGPGLLLRYMLLGIWFNNELTRVICSATAGWRESKNITNHIVKAKRQRFLNPCQEGENVFYVPWTNCPQTCLAMDRIMFWGAKSPWVQTGRI